MERELLVQYLDQDGLPRAWAVGAPEDAEEIRRVASEQLDAYIEKKRKLGYRGDRKLFTVKESEVS